MCESCRLDCIAYYGDDAIWRRKEELYEANPNLSVLGHNVFEDDNLELPHLYWSRHHLGNVSWFRRCWSGLNGHPTPELKRREDYAEYSNEEINTALAALDELIGMANKALGLDVRELRVRTRHGD